MARLLIEEKRYELSVIVTQMACEVLVERMLTPLLSRFRQQRPWNFNVGNKEIRRLYTNLTGDPIQNAACWPAFLAHVHRRHKVVHQGQRVSRDEARASYDVAAGFIQHVENVRESLT